MPFQYLSARLMHAGFIFICMQHDNHDNMQHDSSNRILPESVLYTYSRSGSSFSLLWPPLVRSFSEILLFIRTEVAQKLLGRISKTEVEKALYRGLI